MKDRKAIVAKQCTGPQGRARSPDHPKGVMSYEETDEAHCERLCHSGRTRHPEQQTPLIARAHPEYAPQEGFDPEL